MLRGFSICRVVRYYGSNALESTTRSCIPCGTLLESKLRGGLDFLYWSHHERLLQAPQNSNSDIASSPKDVQNSVDISTPTPATPAAQPLEYTLRSSSSWGRGIGLGAVAAAIILSVPACDQGAKFFQKSSRSLWGHWTRRKQRRLYLTSLMRMELFAKHLSHAWKRHWELNCCSSQGKSSSW